MTPARNLVSWHGRMFSIPYEATEAAYDVTQGYTSVFTATSHSFAFGRVRVLYVHSHNLIWETHMKVIKVFVDV
jgi:hypothetical protein